MLNPDFKDMLSALLGEGVEFLVVGAYALAVHGVPRATGDLDCWIRRGDENARRTLRALQAFGAPAEGLTEDDLIEPDVVLQIGIVPRRIDLLTSIDGVDFKEAWENRLEARIADLDVPVLGREEFIRNKRALGRTKDLADIEALEAAEE